jgi:hypothetical protein
MGDSWVGGDIGGLRTMATTYKNAKDKLDDVIRPLTRAVRRPGRRRGLEGRRRRSPSAPRTPRTRVTAGAFASPRPRGGRHPGHPRRRALHVRDGPAERRARGHEEGRRDGGQGRPAADWSRRTRPVRTSRRRSPRWASTTPCARRSCTRPSRPGWSRRTVAGLYAEVTGKAEVTSGDKITIVDYLRGLYAFDAEDARVGGSQGPHEDRRRQVRGAGGQEGTPVGTQGVPEGRPLAPQGPSRQGRLRRRGHEGRVAGGGHRPRRLRQHQAALRPRPERQTGRRGGRAARWARAWTSCRTSSRRYPYWMSPRPPPAGCWRLPRTMTRGGRGSTPWRWTGAPTWGAGGRWAATAAVVAALPVEVPALAVAAGRWPVVIAATGVIDHAFHEHWSEDIHDHGVVGGVLHGTGNVGCRRPGTTSNDWERTCGMGSRASSDVPASRTPAKIPALPGLGTTWYERGTRYWLRRVRTAVLLLVVMAFFCFRARPLSGLPRRVLPPTVRTVWDWAQVVASCGASSGAGWCSAGAITRTSWTRPPRRRPAAKRDETRRSTGLAVAGALSAPRGTRPAGLAAWGVGWCAAMLTVREYPSEVGARRWLQEHPSRT